MTERKSKTEKAVKLIPPTGQYFADGFGTVAEMITKELNTFAEQQNDPKVKQLYITYRQITTNWQEMAKGFLNQFPDLPKLVENDFYTGLTRLAEYCESIAKEQTPKESTR